MGWNIQNIRQETKRRGFSLFIIYGLNFKSVKQIIKQVAGIDVSQNELVVHLGRMYHDFTLELHGYKVFKNTPKGFESLISWVEKMTHDARIVRFVMEATGVYHESLAYFLDERNYEVSIVLPNKISNYFRTLEIKTVTDKTASQAITQFGLERNLDKWKRPNQLFKRLKQLTRERDQLVTERTMVKNQLHAEQSEAEPNKNSINRLKARIKLLDEQTLEIKKEITLLMGQDQEVNKAVKRISSIPGIGELTAAIILAETNGFELIRNRRQIASYAGFDVKEKLSGTSIKGKPKISKRGNKFLRKAMHMPALTVVQRDEVFKAFYIRLVSKHSIKMKAAVAVQRKLLELAYTLYKTKADYRENHLQEVLSSKDNSHVKSEERSLI